MSKKLKVEFGETWTRVFGPKNELRSWVLAQLLEAYLSARKGKRKTNDEQKVENRIVENLLLIADEIIDRTYEPGRGITFVIEDPVRREIFAAPFRDRILHHFIFSKVVDWWERHLIYDCYSCRKGKGTLFGIKRLLHHIQAVSKNFQKETYVIKLDIKGYFMSLNRKELYRRAIQGLEAQFPNRGPEFRLCKFLWKKIIFDDPVDGVEFRGDRKAWLLLPPSKTLFAQPPGQGIVIGNLSSQLLSNIYLDRLDRYIKFTLGYKHYGRYVDDFFIVVEKKDLEKAKKDIEKIRIFLLRELGLTLHPNKVHIQEIHKGIPFLGAVVYPGYAVPGRRILANYKKALLLVQNGEKDVEDLIPYMGLMVHLNSKKSQEKVFEKFGLEFKS